MPDQPGWRVERLGRTALFLGAVGYSLLAATTMPFTTSANLVTAAPILAMVVLVVVRWPLRTRPGRVPGERPAYPNLPWLLLFGVVTGWELFNYAVHGTRADHPTLSSMTDAIDRFYLLKAVVFMGWLAFGWSLVRLGSRARRRAT